MEVRLAPRNEDERMSEGWVVVEERDSTDFKVCSENNFFLGGLAERYLIRSKLRSLDFLASPRLPLSLSNFSVLHCPSTEQMLPTPDLSHLKRKDYEFIYEPAGTCRFA